MVCMSQSMSQNHDDSNICICIPLMVHIPVFIDYICCIPSYYRFLLEKNNVAFVDFLGVIFLYGCGSKCPECAISGLQDLSCRSNDFIP
jgi:hypothetical protein